MGGRGATGASRTGREAALCGAKGSWLCHTACYTRYGKAWFRVAFGVALIVLSRWLPAYAIAACLFFIGASTSFTSPRFATV